LNKAKASPSIAPFNTFKKSMTYQIEISPTAIQDIENVLEWLKVNAPALSYRWARGCYETMLKLENFPNRCPLAPESQYLEIDVRQLAICKKVPNFV